MTQKNQEMIASILTIIIVVTKLFKLLIKILINLKAILFYS